VARAEDNLHAKFHLVPSIWPQCTNVIDREDRQTGQTDRQTGQLSDSIQQTVLQTVAQNMYQYATIYGQNFTSFHLWKILVLTRRREMYRGHTRLCVTVCVSVSGRMPTLLHGPGCNFGEWYDMPPSCALLEGFAMAAWVEFLWQHHAKY